MGQFQSGSIVLIAFPFSDERVSKRRPALVLLDANDDDLLVAGVTSQASQHRFDVALSDWEHEGLLLPSIVRVHKIAAIEKGLVERTLGMLSENDSARVRAVVHSIMSEMLT